MCLFITGGAGFIGSALIRQLINNTKESIVNFDALTYAGDLRTLNDISDSDQYTFIQGDIRDKDAVKQAIHETKPHAILHLAAESHVDRSIDDSADFITTNINGTHTLLTVAQNYFDGLDEDEREEFRFVHISTDEVYGSLSPKDPPFDNDTPYAPNSPYSASKAASDHLVRAWNRTYKLPTLITHCSNNYGPYQYPEKLIPVVIYNCLSGKDIPVYGTGENIRDWIHVDDHVSALLAVLDHGDIGETYNIGGEHEITNIDMVHQICDILDDIHPTDKGSYRDLVTFVEDRKGHDLRYAICNEKIETTLNWSPQIPFEEGLKQTVEWYINNPDWRDKHAKHAAE